MSGFSFLAEESYILLYAGALGLEMGLVYDLFRIFRRVFRCHFVLTALMDLLFWIFTAWRTFDIMHTYSNGTLRWFAVMGAMVILGIYLKIFSRYVVFLGIFLLKPVEKIIIHCKNCLTKFLKLSIIKIRSKHRKGDKHGNQSDVSNKILQ